MCPHLCAKISHFQFQKVDAILLKTKFLVLAEISGVVVTIQNEAKSHILFTGHSYKFVPCTFLYQLSDYYETLGNGLNI